MAVRRPSSAAVGDNCIDIYVAPVARSVVGGQAVNVAVAWQRLGFPVSYLGAVGDDEAGRRVIDTLQSRGIDCSRVKVLSGSTGVTQLSLDPNGERSIVLEAQGVCDDYRLDEEDVEYLDSCALVHLAHMPGFRSVAPRLASKGVRLSYDFSEAHETYDLEGVDVAAYSSIEEPESESTRMLAHDAIDGHARLALVTCGAAGSLAFDGERIVIEPGRTVDAVDTTGAGDQFLATFAALRLDGLTLEDCLRGATSAALKTCAYVGAWEQPLLAIEDSLA